MTIYSLSNGAAAYRSLHFGLIILTWCNCSVVVFVVADVRGRHFLLADVAGFPVAVPGQTDGRLPTAAHLLAQLHVEAGLVLQERKESHLPGRHHPQPLHLALQGQEHPLHGQVRLMPGSLRFFLFFKLFFKTFGSIDLPSVAIDRWATSKRFDFSFPQYSSFDLGRR